jgi:predicted N-acetyltransferase YhbS
MIKIVALDEVEPVAVDALLDAAFGLDRHARTAYKLREGVAVLPKLSFAAFDKGQLVGTLQSWPVVLKDEQGHRHSLTLVGPVAVSPSVQRGGIGKKLMQALLAAAQAENCDAMMMIGDPEYYDRFFGFSATATQSWELPGPVERHRLLARITRPGGVPAVGRIGPGLTLDDAFASQSLCA